jgi:hypothetical protein
LVLALLTAVTVGLGQAQSPGQPTGDQPEGIQAPAQTVGAMIPIQGRLTDTSGRNLADGNYDVTFRLYDAFEDGTLVCEDRFLVHVTDGLFATHISLCPPSLIDGRPLYLGIKVQGDEEMAPRQAIYPVPYALSLRPGAHVVGDVAHGTALYIENTNEDADNSGLAAVSANGVGLAGSSEHGFGVSGGSLHGTGVYGYSDDGYAGYFEGDVAQSLPADGLVKAAAYANCSGTASSILRSFNNVGGTVTMNIWGQTDGRCTIDWGFDISDRYFVATAFSSGTGSAARGVSCEWASNDEMLDCFRWSADGNPANGKIMVLIY